MAATSALRLVYYNRQMVELSLAYFRRRAGAAALVLVGVGCSHQDESVSKEVPFREARRIVVEVDAMMGAMPSFAPLEVGVSPWLILERNLLAIAPPSSEGLSYPHSEEEVGLLDIAAGGAFSDEDIRDLAERHRDLDESYWDAHFHVLFLKGEYAGNTQDARARAVSIGATRSVAVFSPLSADDSDFEKVAEQSAMVHEIGHAIGLVNLGIPDVSGHSDPSSPSHCNEENCVMGAYSTLQEGVYHFLQGGDVPVLFGPKCLQDVASYYE
jgi:hypothetical protein